MWTQSVSYQSHHRPPQHPPPNPAQKHPAGPDALRADDLSRPGLVFRPRVEVCDLHLHSLHLQVFGRHAAHFKRDLIAFDWHVLPLNAEMEKHKAPWGLWRRFVLFHLKGEHRKCHHKSKYSCKRHHPFQTSQKRWSINLCLQNNLAPWCHRMFGMILIIIISAL